MPARPNVNADVEALHALRQREMNAANDGDVETLVQLRTDDFVTMPPNQPAVQGISGFREWINGMLQQLEWDWKLRSDDVVVAGEWAFDRGTYQAVIRPKGSSDVQEDDGKYLWVCNRARDGSWKIAVAIWNSNRPTPGA